MTPLDYDDAHRKVLREVQAKCLKLGMDPNGDRLVALPNDLMPMIEWAGKRFAELTGKESPKPVDGFKQGNESIQRELPS